MIVGKIQNTASLVIDRLSKEGVVIHRYDSKKTNTIYLKLDKGALGTVRISDHHKRDANYTPRYNIVESSNFYTDTSGDYPRTYSNLDDVNYIVRKILKDRRALMLKHKTNYKEFMYFNSNRESNLPFRFLDSHIVNDRFFTRDKKAQLAISIMSTRHKYNNNRRKL